MSGPLNSGDLVPHGLVADLEAASGARVLSIVPRAGGGASRRGAELVLRHGDGQQEAGYLSFDSRVADPKRMVFFQRETAILQALSGPLAHSGVAAPRFLAAAPTHLALLTALTPGSDAFHAIRDPAQRRSVGGDFIAQLARLHRIPTGDLPLDGFGDPKEAVSRRIRRRIGELRAENLASAPEPILLLALDWLEANVPSDRGPAVIVHGDAGPGNFLHQDGTVTALLDWELCHYGDPMEDLAQIWVRSLFQPFLPMRDVFAAYEAAGGVDVELDRVRYHRLYFQAGFTVSGHATVHGPAGVRPATVGVTLLFYTAHMRVIVQSLAELWGVTLQPVALPDAAPSWRDRTFAMALDDIRDVIAARAGDQEAATKAKSLARLVKFWRARDRWGGAFDAAEMAEISAALGQAVGSVEAGRIALARAVLDRRIPPTTALQLCHARVTRDTALMAEAMGAFKDTYFPPLD